MRHFAFIALLAISAAAAGCAYPGAGPSRTASEQDRLSSSCEARGGILVPSGANTGRPSVDNVCKINGATAIPR